MRWAERRIIERVDQHRSRGNAVMQANTTMHEAAYNQVLLEEGYAPVHSFVEMAFDTVTALLEKSLPSGITLKAAAVPDYRAIWEANEEAFVEEWGHRRVSDEDYIIFVANVIENPGFDPSLWQVAWHGSEIVGVALCEITDRGVGEISELSVRETWRNQGLGRALLIHALYAFKSRGLDHVRVFTDSNPARQLYESVGFRVLTEYMRYQKPVD
jgi:ribosomal protein S18 acetylase RimI-like enzyme